MLWPGFGVARFYLYVRWTATAHWKLACCRGFPDEYSVVFADLVAVLFYGLDGSLRLLPMYKARPGTCKHTNSVDLLRVWDVRQSKKDKVWLMYRYLCSASGPYRLATPCWTASPTELTDHQGGGMKRYNLSRHSSFWCAPGAHQLSSVPRRWPSQAKPT